MMTARNVAAVRTSDPTLADQTLYRPKDLAKLGNSKMPILAWGNGGCAAGQQFGGTCRFTFLLQVRP
jgi:hypothetical protein